MIRSLRTGVSGLKSHQTRMDVVGNNIANVNTIAFKRGRAAFSEVLGQEMLGVGRTAGGTGINPSYIGLGVAPGSIDQNWGQGSLENTGIQTDLALNGDGFFIAKAGDRQMLTRAGNFTFNRNGEFVTSNGLNVQGWAFDPNTGQVNTGELTDVQFDPKAQSPAKRTDNIDVGANLSAALAKGDTTSISAIAYDSQGEAKTLTITFERMLSRSDGDPTDEWAMTLEDEDGTDLTPADNTIAFDADGKLETVGANTITAPPDASDFEMAFDWDINEEGGGVFETLNLRLGDENGGFLSQFDGSTTVAVREQDGHASGTLAGYSINPEGILELNYTNGEQEKIFQLGVGTVNNPGGLEQRGENFYTTSSASGDLQLGRAGRDVSTAVVAGTLEMSNVDLATEFTDMIVAQRGYQASARVITTSDELMQETVQLKR